MSTTKTRSGTRLRGPLTVVLTLALILITSASVLSPPHEAALAATGDAGITIDGSESDWLGNPEVVTKVDPCETTGDKNDDDIFKQGTKLGDVIFGSAFEIVTQSVPTKDDLCVARAAYEFDDDGHAVLFVSWRRAGNTGTASVYIPFGDTDGVLAPGEFVLRFSHDSSAGIVTVAAITTPDGSSLMVSSLGSAVDAAVSGDGYFAEASVDLTAVGLVPDDPCLTVVAPFMATETGQSDTNPGNDDMKDYVNIPDLVISACGTVTVVKEVLGPDGTFEFTSTMLTGDPRDPQPVGDFDVITSGGSGSVTVDPVKPTEGDGTYSLAETVPEGWTLLSATCDDGTDLVAADGAFTLDRDEDLVCTFVNGRAPTLMLSKTVDNLWGGTAVPADFTPTVDQAPAVWETILPFEGPGVHQIAEGGQPGYTAGDWACVGATAFDPELDEVTLDWGDTATCSIVNTDVPASLTLVKSVINDDEGTAVAGDFTLSADGPTPISGTGGVAAVSVAAGTYTLSETGPEGYVASDWVCEGVSLVGDELTLGLGDTAVCTITNDDIHHVADLGVEKTDFDASVVLTEDDPVGEIAYELTVTNLGPDDAIGVVATDTLPPTTTFVSASASQGTCAHAAGVVTCDIGGLAVGGEVTIDLVVSTEALGSLTGPLVENVVVVSGAREDPNPTNNEATEETPVSEVFPLLLPQLSIDKVDLEDPIVLTEDDPDGRITYVVTVTNAADAGPATSVVVTDTLPATVTFHSVVPEQGICSLAGQVLTCQVGDMAPGDVVDITITVDTESFGDLTVGTVTNVVEVAAAEADEPGDNRAEETTDIAEVRDEEVLPETGFPSATLAVGGVGSILLGGLVLGLGRRLDRRS